MNKWHKYFLGICNAVAENSPCLSRKIGAILVRDKSVVATGYNGPPRGIPHCGQARWERDKDLREAVLDTWGQVVPLSINVCPRHLLGYKSGEGLKWCPAAHAEANCLINAARLGVPTLNTTLYLNTGIPCKDCLVKLINAGVKKIVCTEITYYDNLSKRLIEWTKDDLRLVTF